MTDLTREDRDELEAHFGAHAMEVWNAFVDVFGEGNTPQNCIDAYQGRWDNELEYIYDFVDETGMLDGLPDYAKTYFDYEAFARDVFINDVCMGPGGHVFSNHW